MTSLLEITSHSFGYLEKFLGCSVSFLYLCDMITFERNNEPTPNGGAYSIVYYYNAKRMPCDKSKAHYIEIVEYTKDGERICSTYGLV